MAERSTSVVVLYALGDLVVALLVALYLAIPLAVGVLAWWLRR